MIGKGVRSAGHRYWLLAIATVAVVALYVGVSARGAGPGLPLDDGWIHHTYARNLALTGRWAFVPGVVSAGSTAPLWTLLLALGYLLRLPFLLWSYLLGAVCLFLMAQAAMDLWSALWPRWAEYEWFAALLLVSTWPLVWAAASGMETLLFLALATWLLALYASGVERYWFLGFLAGLLVLTRPEGVLLVILLLAGIALRRQARHLPIFVLAASIPLLPYFAFNLALSGVLWPNTFYAKQTEYTVLLARSLPLRFLELLRFSLGGAQGGWRGMSSAHLLLVPGLAVAAWQAMQSDWRRRHLQHTLPLLWAGGHIAAYAWRLPVTYQHGRYLWPALPVWILFGLAGWMGIFARLGVRSRSARLLRRTAAGVLAAMLFLFLLFGAQAYAADVAFIENEMVDVAHWLRDNTSEDALIAAHDIGAIGYFTQRPLLDLAGLVSPEIIPVLNDEEAMARYVRRQDADYLVTAPGWPYRTLTSDPDVQLVYSTGYDWTREQGFNNMSVYRLP